MSTEEWNELLRQISVSTPPADKRSKDAFTYSIQVNDQQAVPVDPNRAPEKFHPLLQQLFDGLKPVD